MNNEYMKWFEYSHLPEGLMRQTSQLFYELAHRLNDGLGCDNSQAAIGFQKLLEAKDCFVRVAKDNSIVVK
jgi:hypothetical protein